MLFKHQTLNITLTGYIQELAASGWSVRQLKVKSTIMLFLVSNLKYLYPHAYCIQHSICLSKTHHHEESSVCLTIFGILSTKLWRSNEWLTNYWNQFLKLKLKHRETFTEHCITRTRSCSEPSRCTMHTQMVWNSLFFTNPAIFHLLSGVSTQSYKINQLYQFLAPGMSSLSQSSGRMYNIQHEHHGFTPTSKTSAMWN